MIKPALISMSLLSLSVTLAAEPAKPAPTAKPAATMTEVPSEVLNQTSCVHGTDTRDLEIVASESGHVVNYTKGGATTVVGTCSVTKDKCQSIFDSIQANLEKAGYVCKP